MSGQQAWRLFSAIHLRSSCSPSSIVNSFPSPSLRSSTPSIILPSTSRTRSLGIFPSAAKRSFGTSSKWRWPRDVSKLGRIEPRRVEVEIPVAASLWKPILFALSLSSSSFILASYLTNKETDMWTQKLGGGSWWRKGNDQPGDEEMFRAEVLESAKRLQDTLDSLPNYLSFLPASITTPIYRTYIAFSESYLSTPPSQRCAISIIALNATILLAWNIPRLKPIMGRWFMHWPVGKNFKLVTLATSIFSHQSLTHFIFNSIALYGFGAAAYTYLARPGIDASHGWDRAVSAYSLPSATTTYHFLAFFLTAGLFSSLSSHLHTNIIRLPRLLRDLRSPGRVSSLSALAVNQSVLPSLGASGAIYATLTMTALAYPDSHVSLIFLPMFPIPIGWGMAGMIGVDLLGLIRGWRMFDHVAHLSGAMFGLIYYKYGKDVWTWLRLKMGARERTLSV